MKTERLQTVDQRSLRTYEEAKTDLYLAFIIISLSHNAISRIIFHVLASRFTLILLHHIPERVRTIAASCRPAVVQQAGNYMQEDCTEIILLAGRKRS